MKGMKTAGCVVLMALFGLMAGCGGDDDESGGSAGGGIGGTWKGTMTVNGSSDVIPLTLVIRDEEIITSGEHGIEVVATANELPLICTGIWYVQSGNLIFTGTADFRYEYFGNLPPGGNTMSGTWSTTAGYGGTWTASR